MYRDSHNKLHLQRGELGTYIYTGLAFLFLLLFLIFVTIGIWNGSAQWGGTGVLMVVPTIIFGIIASLRI